ncbi:hypothetical protein J6TS7_17450 [Paenibacillus dendritiformis]|nr:hypothetical protein J6TS7_17450 [Paenibacillus dendritiformis]
MLVYFIFFIANFVVAYFYIYDKADYIKPFWQSVFVLIMVALMDLIKHYMNKRKNQSK